VSKKITESLHAGRQKSPLYVGRLRGIEQAGQVNEWRVVQVTFVANKGISTAPNLGGGSTIRFGHESAASDLQFQQGKE
jgi:hypothetical protein